MFDAEPHRPALDFTTYWKATAVRLDVEWPEIRVHFEHPGGCR